jgi:hypothetical protein
MKNKILQPKTSNIIVNEYQLKNPYVKEFTFDYKTQSNLNCDFKIADKFNCYFLSLKYHEAYPSYIETRISQNKEDKIKILFCLYDLQQKTDKPVLNSQEFNFNLSLVLDNFTENTFALNEGIEIIKSEKIEKIFTDLNFICLNLNILLVICYNGYDLSQYVYSLSQIDKVENTQGVKILPFEEQLTESLCMIYNINKTDAANLLTSFQNLKSIAHASSQIISLIPGFTDKKKKSISDFFDYEFTNFS